MNLKLLHRLYAAGVFIVTLVIYWMTVQLQFLFGIAVSLLPQAIIFSTTSPGTPFFLIIGNIFSKIPFFENIGLKINLISVFSSALTTFFLYLIAVKLINIFKGKNQKHPLMRLQLYRSSYRSFFTCIQRYILV